MHATRRLPRTASHPLDEPNELYGGPDRRRTPRERQAARATLQPASGDATVQEDVVVENLSLGGVGFRSPQRYRPGAVWRITFGTGPLFLNARIRMVSCRDRGDGTFEVGAEFC